MQLQYQVFYHLTNCFIYVFKYKKMPIGKNIPCLTKGNYRYWAKYTQQQQACYG
jgi:hypothetical protein